MSILSLNSNPQAQQAQQQQQSTEGNGGWLGGRVTRALLGAAAGVGLVTLAKWALGDGGGAVELSSRSLNPLPNNGSSSPLSGRLNISSPFSSSNSSSPFQSTNSSSSPFQGPHAGDGSGSVSLMNAFMNNPENHHHIERRAASPTQLSHKEKLRFTVCSTGSKTDLASVTVHSSNSNFVFTHESISVPNPAYNGYTEITKYVDLGDKGGKSVDSKQLIVDGKWETTGSWFWNAETEENGLSINCHTSQPFIEMGQKPADPYGFSKQTLISVGCDQEGSQPICSNFIKWHPTNN